MTQQPCDQQSPFVLHRQRYRPCGPAVLGDLRSLACRVDGQGAAKELFEGGSGSVLDQPLCFEVAGPEAAAQQRPLAALRVGVVLSGGPAPGGHNVICGLWEGLKNLDAQSQLIGFKGGPSGILDDRHLRLDEDLLRPYLNTGGFDLLGTGRTKIQSPQDFERAWQVCQQHQLDALVIIGGDDSNTNAAHMARDFAGRGGATSVIGIPKTIDGDLQNQWVEISFGFDSAVGVYSELVSNISRDVLSTQKYYHFIRLMGRAASHIVLETALRTQPNMALISEEVWNKSQSLDQVVETIVDMICRRAELGRSFGVVLVPEGLIEFIPEFRALIQELNDILALHRKHYEKISGFSEKNAYINAKLSRDASYLFSKLPLNIQRQLLLDRDQHGNVIVSSIETEALLIGLVQGRLDELRSQGEFKGRFATQRHFLGYEGRCAAPSNFDANYTYCLGKTAALLARYRCNGAMAVMRSLHLEPSSWQPMAAPLGAMLSQERRHGQDSQVIRKGLVNLEGPAFAYFKKQRSSWAAAEAYRFTGPLQYFGDQELCSRVPVCVALNGAAV